MRMWSGPPPQITLGPRAAQDIRTLCLSPSNKPPKSARHAWKLFSSAISDVPWQSLENAQGEIAWLEKKRWIAAPRAWASTSYRIWKWTNHCFFALDPANIGPYCPTWMQLLFRTLYPPAKNILFSQNVQIGKRKREFCSKLQATLV